MQALDKLDNKVFLTERQKVLLLNQADRNKNNQIEYEEFIGFLQSLDFSPDDKPTLDKTGTRFPAGGIKKADPNQSGANLQSINSIIKKFKEYDSSILIFFS